MSDFSTGLMIALVGLTVTFFALALFIGVIYLLKLLFPYKPEAEEAEEGGEAAEETAAAAETSDEDLVAAIAAVAYGKAKQVKGA